MKLWTKTVEEIGQERFDAALSVVLENSPYRPDIAEIRKVAGVNLGVQNPLEAEARERLQRIFAKMRLHTPFLRRIRGKVIRERDDIGRRLDEPEREPDIPAPTFDDITEAAIAAIGWGDRAAGLAHLAEHPSLYAVTIKGDMEPPKFGYRERNSEAIEMRWIAVYSECKLNNAMTRGHDER